MQVVSAGAKRGYGGRLYTTSAGGTCGSTPLTHTTGSASDGGVTWAFGGYSYQVPIGSASVAVNDTLDGVGVWASYFEVVRVSGAGTCFASEIAVKNKGADVSNDPYNHLAAGSTLGHWFAGGGDSTLGAPANPSTAAIVIGKNATTWNKGIVFEDDGLTGANGTTTTGVAIALARNHQINWYVSSGGVAGATINSDVSDLTKYSEFRFVNDGAQWRTRGNIAMLLSGPAGTVAQYLDVQPQTTGGAGPLLRANGSDTNINISLVSMGTGRSQLMDSAFAVRVAADTTGLGFFATAPVAKQAPTGSRGGNAALASLLTALAATGLITDSTTA